MNNVPSGIINYHFWISGFNSRFLFTKRSLLKLHPDRDDRFHPERVRVRILLSLGKVIIIVLWDFCQTIKNNPRTISIVIDFKFSILNFIFIDKVLIKKERGREN